MRPVMLAVAVMLALMVPGLAFETADSDELNAHVATREVLLRSALDARFVLYHHVIRRRVEIEMAAQFDEVAKIARQKAPGLEEKDPEQFWSRVRAFIVRSNSRPAKSAQTAWDETLARGVRAGDRVAADGSHAARGHPLRLDRRCGRARMGHRSGVRRNQDL